MLLKNQKGVNYLFGLWSWIIVNLTARFFKLLEFLRDQVLKNAESVFLVSAILMSVFFNCLKKCHRYMYIKIVDNL